MKSKNLVIILSLLLFVTFVTGVSLLILRSDANNFSSLFILNKYHSIVKKCNSEYSKDSIHSECKAFIDEVFSMEDGKTCFKLLILSEKDGTIFRDEVCEEGSFLSWENPYKDYGKLIPINLSLFYKSKNILQYNLESARFNLLTDETVSDLFSKNSSLTELKGKIYLQEIANIEDHGYYLSSSLPIGNGFLHKVFFKDFSLVNISKVKDTLSLNAIVEINGSTVNMLAKTKSLSFQSSNPEEMPIKVGLDNFNLLAVDTSYQASFAFLQQSDKPSDLELLTYCSTLSNDPVRDAFCLNKRDDFEEFVVEDIDLYIAGNVLEDVNTEFKNLTLISILEK